LGSLSHLSTHFGFQLNKDSYELYDVFHGEEQARNSFTIRDSKIERPFSLIHCDLWGPYHTRSLSGCYYFLCVVDDFSRAIWVHL